jgi:histidinol-phosphate aminotransferase
MLKARQAVTDLHEYRPPLGDRRNLLRLDFNENTVGASARVLQRLRELEPQDLARYPDRVPTELQAAEFFRLRPEEVLLTNGVDEAIHLLSETYLEPGDRAIVVVPTFAMYELSLLATGARLVRVLAKQDFAFPVEEVLAGVNEWTRAVVIANPNNPTGQAVSRIDLLRIIAAAPQAAILVDEAYFEFCGETLLDQIGLLPNLFVARTFSKAYGLAGLRMGVLLGAEAQIKMVRRLASPYNVNTAALACLPVALADQEYVARYVDEVRAGRERLQNTLRELGLRYWPSQANFVLVDLGPQHRAFVQAMRDRGILVRDRSSDPGCDGCVRITVGSVEHTDKLLLAIAETLAEIGLPAEARA